MTDRQRKLIIPVVIVLATFFFRLDSMDVMKSEIGGDERGYVYHAVSALAWGLKQCRSLFGPTATCGIQPPRQHQYVIDAFRETGIDRFLVGEISFDQVAPPSRSPHYPPYGRFVKTPLGILFSRWNATAITLGLSMWSFGADLVGYMLFQSILLSLAAALVFELGYRLSNIIGGALAGGAWAFYTLYDSAIDERILPQSFSMVFFALGMLMLAYGMQRKHGGWLFAGCAASALSGLYHIGHRLAAMFIIPSFFLAYYLLGRRSERRLAIWVGLSLIVVGVMVITTFFLRAQPVEMETGEPLSFADHFLHVLLSDESSTDYPRTSYLYTEGWLSEVALPGPQATSPWAMMQDLMRDPDLTARVMTLKMYRIWSFPYIRGELPAGGIFRYSPQHQLLVVLGFAGLILLMGYRDWRGGFGWILAIGVIPTTFIHSYLSGSPRYMLTLVGPLFAMGGALLGTVVAAGLRRSWRNMATGLASFVAAVIITQYLDVALVSMALPSLSFRYSYGIVLGIKVALLVGIFVWMLWQIRPTNWRMGVTIALLVGLIVIIVIGQLKDDWQQQWELEITDGLVARQLITLPAQLPWSNAEIPWLLFDSAPEDDYEVWINGQMVKPANESLPVWQSEQDRHEHQRIWRGLQPHASYLRPGETLTVEARGVSDTSSNLFGDFPSDDPALYVGPSVDYIGYYRSYLRASRWSPIFEPRVPQPFDLRGITYQSSVVLPDGQTLADDLSPSFGRQHGLFRVFLGAFEFGEAPPPRADASIVADLKARLTPPEEDVVLVEDGMPKLRFLGHSVEYLPEQSRDKLDLYFEVLDMLERDYYIWFYGYVQDVSILPQDRQESGYAYLDRHRSSIPTSSWQPGRLYRETLAFQTNPGDYDLTFGFTSDDEDHSRLFLDQDDAYAVSLGWYHIFRDRTPERLEGFEVPSWIDWIDRNLQPGSRILVTDVEGVNADTDKIFVLLDSKRDVVRQVVDQQVGYVLYFGSSEIDQQYLKSLLSEYSANLSMVHRGDGWHLYKVDY